MLSVGIDLLLWGLEHSHFHLGGCRRHPACPVIRGEVWFLGPPLLLLFSCYRHMMRAMKRVITTIFIICVVLPLSVTAHARNLASQISAVEKAYQNAGGIKANFTQTTYLKLLEKTVNKRGKIYIKDGGKFRFEYRGGKNYVSDGSTLWVYIPNDPGSLTVFEVNSDTVPKEAMKFLSGFSNLKKDFRVKPSKEFAVLAPGESAFYLIPKSRKAHFKALDAKFNADNLLEELKVHNKSGNISTYRFSKIKTSKNLRESLFTH